MEIVKVYAFQIKSLREGEVDSYLIRYVCFHHFSDVNPEVLNSAKSFGLEVISLGGSQDSGDYRT